MADAVRKVGNPAWVSGTTGNPRGRPPVSLSLADAIRRRFPPERLVDIAERLVDTSKDDRVKAQVLQMLSDRGYGKVLTTVELTANQPNAATDWSQVSIERRLELLNAADQMESLAAIDDESESVIDVEAAED